MKGFVKVSCIIALFLLGAGIALTIAGCALGGGENVAQVVNDVTGGKVQIDTADGFNFSIGGYTSDDVKDAVKGILDNKIYNLDDFGTVYDDGEKTLQGDIEKYAISADKVEKLSVDVGGCDLTIEYSDDNDFWVEAKNVKKFQGYAKGDTLHLISTVKGNITGANIKNVKITLYVPKEFKFDEAELELGAGIIKGKELLANKTELKIGAGEIVFDSIDSDKLKVEVGAGSVKLKNAGIGKLECEVGAGNVEFEGRLNGDSKVKCALGNASLKLENNYKDFDYKIECAAGNVSLADQKFSGLANDKKIDNDGEYDMEINCSMGNVTVKFEE